MGGSTVIINILLFQCGDRLWTSESDVYRRQILTFNVGPRTESVQSTSYIETIRDNYVTKYNNVASLKTQFSLNLHDN